MCTPGSNSSSSTDCEEPEYHMHMDTDRDGAVDFAGFDVWEWGAGKTGAIILCNNDGDETPSRSDNEDSKINSGNDTDEVAPLVFLRKGCPPPADWQGFLEVSAADAARIRVFDSNATGAPEALGPTKGRKYKFPDLNFTKKVLAAEALDYAGSPNPDGTLFDGVITLTFTIMKGAAVKHKEQGKVRVAPWLMHNHLDAAETVFVVKAPNIGFPSTTTPTTTVAKDNGRFVGELAGFVAAAGCSLETYSDPDIWMQDCMEFGFANLPLWGFRSVMHANREGTDRTLTVFPKKLRKADRGYFEKGWAATSNTFDSTGNLECTPPCTSKAGKKYPWGRIYHGAGRIVPRRRPELFDVGVSDFLNSQLVQAPIEIDTGWLNVGHVDEIISFVPGGGSQGFRLLLASPRRAYKILNENKAKHPDSKMLVGRMFPEDLFDPVTRAFLGTKWHKAEVTIKKFLDTGIGSHFPNNGVMKNFNDAKQSTLDAIRTKLTDELGLKPTDIIDVPIIFMPNDLSPTFADALTAGMVNMLVINKHCVVPKPFGPVVGGKDLFEDDLEGKLKADGLTVHFLDDWYEYHVALGEVHCGTNTLRKPTKVKWWEFVP